MGERRSVECDWIQFTWLRINSSTVLVVTTMECTDICPVGVMVKTEFWQKKNVNRGFIVQKWSEDERERWCMKTERSGAVKHLRTWQLCSAFVQDRADESQMRERIQNTHSPRYISNLLGISECAVHHAVMCQGAVWTAVIRGLKQDNLQLGQMTPWGGVTERSWCYVIWHRWHKWTHDELWPGDQLVLAMTASLERVIKSQWRFKAALINIFRITVEHIQCNVKGVTHTHRIISQFHSSPSLHGALMHLSSQVFCDVFPLWLSWFTLTTLISIVFRCNRQLFSVTKL